MSRGSAAIPFQRKNGIPQRNCCHKHKHSFFLLFSHVLFHLESLKKKRGESVCEAEVGFKLFLRKRNLYLFPKFFIIFHLQSLSHSLFIFIPPKTVIAFQSPLFVFLCLQQTIFSRSGEWSSVFHNFIKSHTRTYSLLLFFSLKKCSISFFLFEIM